MLVDSRENFQKLAAFAETYTPQLRPRLEHYAGERPLVITSYSIHYTKLYEGISI